MVKILSTISLILLIAGGFITLKNKVRLVKEIADLEKATKEFESNQGMLTELLGVPKKLKNEIADTTNAIEEKTSAEKDIKKSISDFKEDIKSKTEELAERQDQLKSLKQLIAKAGGIDEMGGIIESIKKQMEETSDAISSKEAKLSQIQAENRKVTASIEERKKQFEFYSSGSSLPGLKTSVRDIYDNWGFVTLNAGNSSGVISNSTLDVVRDGQVVAKLLVKTVEEKSASAAVIPDSISQGLNLEVGDLVVATTPAVTDTTNP